jgi:hypothetical protein
MVFARKGRAVKRLLLLLAACLVVIGVIAGPAGAYYNPKPNTAYVFVFDNRGWDEWVGPGPTDTMHHTGAIPRGFRVALGTMWADGQFGARLAPAEFLHTYSLQRAQGGWARRALDPGRTVRYWSPVYQPDASQMPGVWARDWWVPLGNLATGSYTGWVRERTVAAYPTWIDENGNVLSDPVWLPKYSMKWQQLFTVK